MKLPSSVTYERIMATIQAVGVAIVAVLVLFGVIMPPEADPILMPETASRGITNFDALVADTVTSDITGDVTGDLTGDVTGDLDGSAVLDTLNTAVTAYALTGAQTLTPTVTYYNLAPAAVLTLTLGAGTAGDLLILHSTVATNTVIVDTGATVGGGNVTLAADDMALFIFGNSKWVEIASPDNS